MNRPTDQPNRLTDLLLALLLTAALMACGDEPECGRGTVLRGNTCVLEEADTGLEEVGPDADPDTPDISDASTDSGSEDAIESDISDAADSSSDVPSADAGMDTPDADAPTDTTPEPPHWSSLSWSEAINVPVDPETGRAESTAIPIEGTPRSLAIRAIPRWRPSAEPEVCFVLDDVLFDGTEWVPDWASMDPGLACTDCAQRVSIGDRQATAAFRNDGLPLGNGTLDFAVQTVDCARATEAARAQYPETPDSFDVQWFLDESEVSDPTLSIAVGIDPDTGYATDSARIATALESAAARFDDIGITLQVERIVALPAGSTPELYFGPGLMRPMNRLFGRWVNELVEPEDGLVLPVFVLPCLVRISGTGAATTQTVFAGYTPRIPGGLSTRETADGVWLAVNDCPDAGPNAGADLAADEPELFGRLLAHELGHALGLYHSDQSFGAHLVDDFDNNMMRSSIVFDSDDEPLRFDPDQVTVMTQHPYVRSEE